MPSTFAGRAAAYLTTSTSIAGIAVAVPTLTGALLGLISWHDATLPLIGAAVSILLPQTAAQPAPGAAVLKPVPVVLPDQAHAAVVAAVQQVSQQVAQIAARSHNPSLAFMSMAAPAIAEAVAQRINAGLAPAPPQAGDTAVPAAQAVADAAQDAAEVVAFVAKGV